MTAQWCRGQSRGWGEEMRWGRAAVRLVPALQRDTCYADCSSSRDTAVHWAQTWEPSHCRSQCLSSSQVRWHCRFIRTFVHSYCSEWILTSFWTWTVIRVSYCACLFTTNTENKILHNGHSVSLWLNIKLNPDPKMSLLLIAFSSEDSNAPFLSHTFPTFYLISSNFLFPSIK